MCHYNLFLFCASRWVGNTELQQMLLTVSLSVSPFGDHAIDDLLIQTLVASRKDDQSHSLASYDLNATVHYAKDAVGPVPGVNDHGMELISTRKYTKNHWGSSILSMVTVTCPKREDRVLKASMLKPRGTHSRCSALPLTQIASC